MAGMERENYQAVCTSIFENKEQWKAANAANQTF
jgi:hypothetical protein